MRNLAVLILSVLLLFVGVSFSINSALAGDGESNDVLLDINQAP